MIDLNGAYTHNVDAKGRLTLPAKFRKAIPSDELVATINPLNECLYVFGSSEDFNDWVKSFFEHDGGFNSKNLQHVAAQRALKERAMDVTVDSAGRINLPSALCAAVGITREVTIIGNTGYFEIWDAKRREEAKAAFDLADILFG